MKVLMMVLLVGWSFGGWSNDGIGRNRRRSEHASLSLVEPNPFKEHKHVEDGVYVIPSHIEELVTANI